ncbi:hypothetical protein FD514_08350 [Cutibacterium acnes]|nr:hypothetical protein COH13_08370 [Cutibacterium acnes]TLG13687.1 hypothetical protein FD522_06235 [Cutibacterium acnes]TLG16116.1 hypothetical protein FD521_09065 [Cutibacterium acnes]TLG19992.1 hypothetical protein FD516_11095 [Cutibacterium acnes]TLG21200.1 hypothetical protein FD514_08350 [Cutibacterium acnes]
MHDTDDVLKGGILMAAFTERGLTRNIDFTDMTALTQHGPHQKRYGPCHVHGETGLTPTRW